MRAPQLASTKLEIIADTSRPLFARPFGRAKSDFRGRRPCSTGHIVWVAARMRMLLQKSCSFIYESTPRANKCSVNARIGVQLRSSPV